MAIETYVAILHESSTPTDSGLPVVCPLQPDGAPKPTIDHRGVLYQLLDTDRGSGVLDFGRTQN